MVTNSKGTPAIERIWNDANRMTKIWNIYSIIDYTYDPAGQVWKEGTTVTGGGPVREVRYCRYPNGEVSQITYPNGSTVVNRFYTARGQLSSVGWGSGSTSYVYHLDGKVDYQPFTNGVVTRYGYDGRGMIQSVSHKNGAGQNLAYREYWRDDRDRILAWKRGVGGPNPMEDGRGDRYRYDAEGQLEMADYRALHPEEATPQDPKRRDVFYYDQLGNRMGSANVIASWGPDAVSFSRENNGLNQYVSWPRGPINQDDDMGPDWGAPGGANGVTMQEGWITASYNALNQPKAIWSPSYPGGALAQYLWFGFDPLGRCVKRWMGSATGNAPGSNPATYYYYDGWNLIQEGPGGTTVARTYVHGGRVDEIVASQAGAEWVYHHYDARGHCILLTNASDGTTREQYDYDAFGYPYFYSASGVKLGSTAQFGNRFLFTGREWLKDLRVYDYRNRIYQPELGRFLQPDPIQFRAGDYNLYRYCHNDPVNRSDPTGLISWEAGAGLTSWGNGAWTCNGSFNQDLVEVYQKIRGAIADFFGGRKQAAGRSEKGRLKVGSANVNMSNRIFNYRDPDDTRGGYTPNPLKTKGGVSATSAQDSPGVLSLTYNLEIQTRLNLSRGAFTRLFAKLREPDHWNDFSNAKDRFQGAAGALVGQRFDTANSAAEGLRSAVDPVVQQVYDESRYWDKDGLHRPRDPNGNLVSPDE